MLEVVDQITEDGGAQPALYKLLTGALTELDREGNPLVVSAFVVKVLALEGVQPSFDLCVSCGATEPLVAIDVAQGGVLCNDCRAGDPISDAARLSLQSIADGHVRRVLEATDEPTATELETLASRMIEQHLERRLRSSPVVDQHLTP